MDPMIQTAVNLGIPLVLLIGTSMSSGKTSAGRVIIRALKYMGLNVAAAKLTGSARYRDILQFRDAGADYDDVTGLLGHAFSPPPDCRTLPRPGTA